MMTFIFVDLYYSWWFSLKWLFDYDVLCCVLLPLAFLLSAIVLLDTSDATQINLIISIITITLCFHRYFTWSLLPY